MTEAEKLERAAVDAMLAVDVENGARADMYQLARAAISVTLSAVDSKLDDLLARYPSAVTEWSAAVREIRRSLFPRSPGD